MPPIAGLIIGWLLTDVALGVIAGILVFIGIAGGVWIGATVDAPRKQRNDLRDMYANTAAAIFGAGYERYISMVVGHLESYLSRPPSGNARVRPETGRTVVEQDDGRILVFGVEPPGNVYSQSF